MLVVKCGMRRVLESEEEWNCLYGVYTSVKEIKQVNKDCIREKGMNDSVDNLYPMRISVGSQ